MNGLSRSDYAWIFGIGIALILSETVNNYNFLSFTGVILVCRGILQLLFPSKFAFVSKTEEQ